MRCTLGTVVAAAAALVFGSALWPENAHVSVAPTASVADDRADPAAPQRVPLIAENDRDRQVREKLESRTLECRFLDTMLSDVLALVGEKLAIDVYAPKSEFAAELEMPVTLQLTHTQPTARTILELALRQAQLAYTVRDGIVMICRPETALEIRVYDCGGLRLPAVERTVGFGGAPAEGSTREPPLVEKLSGTEVLRELIAEVVRPESWDLAGGPSQIRALDERLIVRASPETHREIELLLEQLAAVKTASR